MDAASYFDGEPWARAVALIEQGKLGRVVAVAAQECCAAGDLEAAHTRWSGRILGLVGQAVRSDITSVPGAVSVVARHAGNVVTRLFLDGSGRESSSCFEIVGTEALLLWKPDVRTLARVDAASGMRLSFEHPYATSLTSPGGGGGEA